MLTMEINKTYSQTTKEMEEHSKGICYYPYEKTASFVYYNNVKISVTINI